MAPHDDTTEKRAHLAVRGDRRSSASHGRSRRFDAAQQSVIAKQYRVYTVVYLRQHHVRRTVLICTPARRQRDLRPRPGAFVVKAGLARTQRHHRSSITNPPKLVRRSFAIRSNTGCDRRRSGENGVSYGFFRSVVPRRERFLPMGQLHVSSSRLGPDRLGALDRRHRRHRTDVRRQLQGRHCLPGTETQHASDLLKTQFPSQAGDSATLVIKAAAGIDDPAVKGQITALLASAAAIPEVGGVVSPYDDPAAVSADRKSPTRRIVYNKTVDQVAARNATALLDLGDHSNAPGFLVEVGGPIAAHAETVSPERRN